VLAATVADAELFVTLDTDPEALAEACVSVEALPVAEVVAPQLQSSRSTAAGNTGALV
jgi:hypothetical protein